MEGVDLNMLGALAQSVQECGMPVIAGGDWNADPRQLLETGFLDQVRGRLFVPSHPCGTCTAGKKASVIDYFVVTGVAAAVQSIGTVKGSCVKTHRPVSMKFWQAPTKLRMRKLKRPPKIGLQVPHGPRRKPPDWAPVRDQAHAAYIKAMTGTAGEALVAFDHLYKAFADLAEWEIAEVTETDITTW